jgi:CheY-like chemotaxis protein
MLMSVILLVEDDPDNREMLTQVVTCMRFDIIAAQSAEDACGG